MYVIEADFLKRKRLELKKELELKTKSNLKEKHKNNTDAMLLLNDFQNKCIELLKKPK